MIVAVVEIGEMHVGMNQERVGVGMGMGSRLITFMLVPMVFVVVVSVLVPKGRMLMPVSVLLPKKQRAGTEHDASGHGEL